jgi:predicted protein tyrosine phosphatase
MIFVMGKAHWSKLQRRFRAALAGKRVICLDVPDDYSIMQPELVRLLEARMSSADCLTYSVDATFAPQGLPII